MSRHTDARCFGSGEGKTVRVIKGTVAVISVAVVLLLVGCSSAPTDDASQSPVTIGNPMIPVSGPLSTAVWTEVSSNFDNGITDSSPLYDVAKVEDRTPGTITVFVDQDLGQQQRETIGEDVFVKGAPHNTDLTTVVVRDAPGDETTVERGNVQDITQ